MIDNIEERVTKGNIDKLAIIVNGRDEDLKAQVMVRLIGDRLVYETTLKVDRSVFDADQSTIDEFFAVAKKTMREVISGKRELNAVTV